MAKVTAIILAAGTSSRMGETNKLFLDLKGKPIIEWVIEGVSQSAVEEIILVGSELSMDRLAQFDDCKIRLIENANYKSGMTSSIQAGVSAASPKNGLMICLGDLPLIRTETLNQLILAFDDQSIVVPTYQGQKGNPVIFPSSLRQAILDHKEPEGCKGVVQANKKLVKLIEVDDEGILKDVDTHEQYLDIGR